MIPFYQWTTISLGPITIQVWGLFVALGMLISIIIGWKRAKRLGVNPEQLLDLSMYMIVIGMIFARVFHIVFYEPSFYLSSPVEIFKVWNGGFSSFGGLFGAIIGFSWYIKSRKIEKKNIWSWADQIVFASLFGWMVARVGCSSIHDHLGKLSDSFLAVNFPGGSRLDMGIMEIIFLVPLALVFYFTRNKKLFSGFYFLSVLVYYGALRFALDFFRATDIAHADTRYLGLTPAQYFGMVAFVVGLYLFRKRGKMAK